jgi:hypothetical protein
VPKIRVRSKGARCPLCRVPFLQGESEDYRCGGCEVRYHADCAEELGGCATLGCPRMGVAPSEATPADQSGAHRRRRMAEAASQRRRRRQNLRARHREELEEAGQRPALSVGDLGEAVVLGLDCLSCLGCLLTMGCLMAVAGLVFTVR